MTKKHTYDEVKHFIEVKSNSGCKLISEEYKGSKEILKAICPNDHLFELRFSDFIKGVRCKECNFAKHRERMEIKKEISKTVKRREVEKEEYKVDLSDYTSNKSYLNFTCNNGHTWRAKWNSWTNGFRCKECFDEIRGDTLKKSDNDIINYFQSEGFEVIDFSYKNNKSPITLKCINNHTFQKSWQQFYKDGQRCPDCNENWNRWDLEKVREYTESQGMSLISNKYVNSSSKLIFKCSRGHHFPTTWASFYSMGTGCPLCKVSKGEREVIRILSKKILILLKSQD